MSRVTSSYSDPREAWRQLDRDAPRIKTRPEPPIRRDAEASRRSIDSATRRYDRNDDKRSHAEIRVLRKPESHTHRDDRRRYGAFANPHDAGRTYDKIRPIQETTNVAYELKERDRERLARHRNLTRSMGPPESMSSPALVSPPIIPPPPPVELQNWDYLRRGPSTDNLRTAGGPSHSPNARATDARIDKRSHSTNEVGTADSPSPPIAYERLPPPIQLAGAQYRSGQSTMSISNDPFVEPPVAHQDASLVSALSLPAKEDRFARRNDMDHKSRFIQQNVNQKMNHRPASRGSVHDNYVHDRRRASIDVLRDSGYARREYVPKGRQSLDIVPQSSSDMTQMRSTFRGHDDRTMRSSVDTARPAHSAAPETDKLQPYRFSSESYGTGRVQPPVYNAQPIPPISSKGRTWSRPMMTRQWSSGSGRVRAGESLGPHLSNGSAKDAQSIGDDARIRRDFHSDLPGLTPSIVGAEKPRSSIQRRRDRDAPSTSSASEFGTAHHAGATRPKPTIHQDREVTVKRKSYSARREINGLIFETESAGAVAKARRRGSDDQSAHSTKPNDEKPRQSSDRDTRKMTLIAQKASPAAKELADKQQTAIRHSFDVIRRSSDTHDSTQQVARRAEDGDRRPERDTSSLGFKPKPPSQGVDNDEISRLSKVAFVEDREAGIQVAPPLAGSTGASLAAITEDQPLVPRRHTSTTLSVSAAPSDRTPSPSADAKEIPDSLVASDSLPLPDSCGATNQPGQVDRPRSRLLSMLGWETKPKTEIYRPSLQVMEARIPDFDRSHSPDMEQKDANLASEAMRDSQDEGTAPGAAATMGDLSDSNDSSATGDAFAEQDELEIASRGIRSAPAAVRERSASPAAVLQSVSSERDVESSSRAAEMYATSDSGEIAEAQYVPNLRKVPDLKAQGLNRLKFSRRRNASSATSQGSESEIPSSGRTTPILSQFSDANVRRASQSRWQTPFMSKRKGTRDGATATQSTAQGGSSTGRKTALGADDHTRRSIVNLDTNAIAETSNALKIPSTFEDPSTDQDTTQSSAAARTISASETPNAFRIPSVLASQTYRVQSPQKNASLTSLESTKSQVSARADDSRAPSRATETTDEDYFTDDFADEQFAVKSGRDGQMDPAPSSGMQTPKASISGGQAVSRDDSRTLSGMAVAGMGGILAWVTGTPTSSTDAEKGKQSSANDGHMSGSEDWLSKSRDLIHEDGSMISDVPRTIEVPQSDEELETDDGVLKKGHSSSSGEKHPVPTTASRSQLDASSSSEDSHTSQASRGSGSKMMLTAAENVGQVALTRPFDAVQVSTTVTPPVLVPENDISPPRLPPPASAREVRNDGSYKRFSFPGIRRRSLARRSGPALHTRTRATADRAATPDQNARPVSRSLPLSISRLAAFSREPRGRRSALSEYSAAPSYHTVAPPGQSTLERGAPSRRPIAINRGVAANPTSVHNPPSRSRFVPRATSAPASSNRTPARTPSAMIRSISRDSAGRRRFGIPLIRRKRSHPMVDTRPPNVASAQATGVGPTPSTSAQVATVVMQPDSDTSNAPTVSTGVPCGQDRSRGNTLDVSDYKKKPKPQRQPSKVGLAMNEAMHKGLISAMALADRLSGVDENLQASRPPPSESTGAIGKRRVTFSQSRTDTEAGVMSAKGATGGTEANLDQRKGKKALSPLLFSKVTIQDTDVLHMRKEGKFWSQSTGHPGPLSPTPHSTSSLRSAMKSGSSSHVNLASPSPRYSVIARDPGNLLNMTGRPPSFRSTTTSDVVPHVAMPSSLETARKAEGKSKFVDGLEDDIHEAQPLATTSRPALAINTDVPDTIPVTTQILETPLDARKRSASSPSIHGSANSPGRSPGLMGRTTSYFGLGKATAGESSPVSAKSDKKKVWVLSSEEYNTAQRANT